LSKTKVGLVLSSGGARGAAHVGVLKVLEEAGIVPDIIVGASMGAELGGAYAAGIPIPQLEGLLRSTSFGLLKGLLGDQTIEELPVRFAAVVTDLESGQPIILTEGSLVEAIRASLSVPGLFTPVWMLGITKGIESQRYAPNVFSVLFQMSTVFQKRLLDARLAQHPPDVLIRPDFSEDPPCYSRIGCGIEAGEQAARRALPEILRTMASRMQTHM